MVRFTMQSKLLIKFYGYWVIYAFHAYQLISFCLLPSVYLSVCFVHVTVCASVQLKRGSRNFRQGGGGGGGSRPDCQKTVLMCFFRTYFTVFTEGVQWLFQRKLMVSEGGGQHLSWGSNFFQGGGGGGGQNANFYRNPYIL